MLRRLLCEPSRSSESRKGHEYGRKVAGHGSRWMIARCRGRWPMMRPWLTVPQTQKPRLWPSELPLFVGCVLGKDSDGHLNSSLGLPKMSHLLAYCPRRSSSSPKAAENDNLTGIYAMGVNGSLANTGFLVRLQPSLAEFMGPLLFS